MVKSKGLSRVSSSGIRTTADFSPPFSQISPASSAFPIPSLLGAGPTACKDESEVNWAQSDIEEEEELEEIALEPDFNYSTCNPLGGKFKADYPARRLHTKTDASTFGHLVPNDSIAVCMTPLNLGHPFTPSTLGPVPGSHDICTPCRFTDKGQFSCWWVKRKAYPVKMHENVLRSDSLHVTLQLSISNGFFYGIYQSKPNINEYIVIECCVHHTLAV